MRTINFKFYYFGPFLYSTKLTEEEVNIILDICDKQKGKDCREKLAGHLKEEFILPNDKIMEVLQPYFNSYCKALFETRGQTINKLTMTAAWVNYMKAGEFNPPHTHLGIKNSLSCVLYLNIPKNMTKEKYIGTSYPPGSISFLYGENLKNNITEVTSIPEVGDFYIFPSWLKHFVSPFNSTGVRISVSANIVEEKND